MIDQFNKINRNFGANRVSLVTVSNDRIQFAIADWGVFQIEIGGEVKEIRGLVAVETANADWLRKVGLGLVRDDSGEMRERSQFDKDANEIVRKLEGFDKKLESRRPG